MLSTPAHRSSRSFFVWSQRRQLLRHVCGLLSLAMMASGLAVESRADTVYASSFGTGELIRYDSSDPTGSRTVLSSGSLVGPAALAIGPDGNLYIGDAGDGGATAPSILRYNVSSGSLSTVHTFAAYSVFPGSLAFRGSDLLVGRNPFFADTGEIVRLTGVTGGSVSVSNFTSGGKLASSPGLTIDGSGRLYVASQTYDFQTGIADGSVWQFAADGSPLGELIADGANGLAGPTGLAVNGTTLYTASIMSGTILQTNLTTGTTTSFASTGSAFEVGSLAVLSDGSLLAGSPSGFTGTIYHFGSDGSLLGSFASGLGQIGGIATVAAVPEPATGLLAVTGLAVVGLAMRRRRVGAD